MNEVSEVNIDDSEGLNINTPTGILYNIISNEPTTFNKDSLFKYLYEHKNSTTIPDSYMNDYTTETNFNSQTPLMYSVIINNLNFVKILLKHDIGKVDDFNKCALDYAKEMSEKLVDENELGINSLIRQYLEEYEYYE